MNNFLLLAFLFFMGSIIGWGIEVLFRRFFSGANPERKWINPGFLTGPYLPLYGFGLTALYLIASCEQYSRVDNPVLNKIVLFIFMAACMTVIEYIAGVIFIRGMKIKLWDYTGMWGNVQGIICPLFSFFWAVLGALYYFLIHPHILSALDWLSRNLAFSFVIGFFYGVFTLDVIYSTKFMVKLRRFADEKQIVIRYEELKEHIRQYNFSRKVKLGFFFSMHTQLPNEEFISEIYEKIRQRKESLKNKLIK
jgi:uncharacterized membrane protein